MVVVGAVEILGDVHTLDPDLAVLHEAISVGQRCAAFADRLDLGAREHESGGESVADLIIEMGAFVFDIDLTCFHIALNCSYIN